MSRRSPTARMAQRSAVRQPVAASEAADAFIIEGDPEEGDEAREMEEYTFKTAKAVGRRSRKEELLTPMKRSFPRPC